MDMHAAYREVGSYRAAAEICGTTPKTVKRSVEAALKAESGAVPGEVRHNYDGVADVVAETVARTKGRITAKRLLPVARAAGYTGSARNFRRLVAEAKVAWRQKNHRGRRPGIWAPGDTVVFDWGEIGPLFVFCAVVAWSRFRFVYFTDNLGAEATMEALAECFETIGGVPHMALTDRMGCLKGGTVAGLVIPTPAYVRFATHYGFRPDFCEGADPESKGLVENLVGYVKSDLMVPEQLSVADLADANAKGIAWCAEVNAAVHSEICGRPSRAARRRGRAVRRPALPAGTDRQDRDPQGGQAELRALRLGPLLGAERPHRPRGQPPGEGRGDPGGVPGRDRRRAPGRFPW